MRPGWLHYPLQNLRAHPFRVAFTSIAVAVVAGVLSYLFSLTDSLHQALRREADPSNVLVLAQASTAESNSAFPFDQLQRLRGIPGVATAEDGTPLVSGELMAPLRMARRQGGSPVNVAVRGVDLETARAVHPQVRLVEGRWFAAGADEVVVGKSAQQRLAGTAIGDEVAVGSHRFLIVGVVAANQGSHESEIWGPRANVGAALQRAGLTSATVRLADSEPATVANVVNHISAGSIGLRPIREVEYFSQQTTSGLLLDSLAQGLTAILAVGAIFAAINTMHAAVASRRQEIGILRAIGFPPQRILLSFLVESLTIALLGGVAGCVACWANIALRGELLDLVGQSHFTSVAFALQMSPRAAAAALAAAVLIGVLGGIGPAWSASRVTVVQALRAD